jgi:SSS family transporter
VAVVTLLPALALDAVTGIGVENCILICGVATILYCCVGGLDAVIWSDFVQGIVLLGGAVTVLALLIMNTNGGFTGFVDIAAEHEKWRLLDFRFLLKEPVFWVVVIQGLVSNLSSYTSDQCVVQRYIACTDEKKAANSIWFNGVLSVIASIIFYAIGTGLYTHYFSSPEMMDITMPKSDSVFPIFMAIELHPVIAGLVIAAIFAATISTLSANLTSASTAITTDFVVRFKPTLTGPQQVKCGRICVIVIGILGVGAALTLAQLPTRSLFDEFQKFIAMLTAGLTALFFMGVFMPRVGGIPAVIGLLANYFVCYGLDCIPAGSALSFIKPHPFVYGGIGLVVCVVLAWVLSIFFPNTRDTKGLTHFSRPKSEEED